MGGRRDVLLCTDPDILEHLRSGAKHVGGCWVVDALLAKE
jgi:hypothetical protein